MNNALKIFVGFDQREAVVFHTCCQSLIELSSEPLSICPLSLKSIRGVYKECHSDGSNDFIYSRFLVPFLCGFKGKALFIDGDMIFREDAVKLFDLFDPEKAVQVVKHSYKTKFPNKYLGNKNEDYPRKNWSSVILWNAEHPKNSCLDPQFVADKTGAYLHRFSWLEDELIGSLPLEWNWLVGEYPQNEKAKLLHYTVGAPCFLDYRSESYSDDWVEVYERVSQGWE